MRRHLALILFVTGLLILAMGVMLVKRHQESQPRNRAVAFAGPIDLIDVNGRSIHGSDLQGRPSAVFFGFTYCPDVCPTTLIALSAAMRTLGRDADRLNFAFITVDPERDDAPYLKLYLTSFDPRIRGLTGTVAQVRQAAASYGAYFRKVTEAGGDYTVDHSSSIFLFDAKGRFQGVIPYGATPADLSRRLGELAHPGPRSALSSTRGHFPEIPRRRAIISDNVPTARNTTVSCRSQ